MISRTKVGNMTVGQERVNLRGVVKGKGVELSCTGVSVRPTADRVSPVLAMWIAGYSLPAIKAETGMSSEVALDILRQVRGELRVHVTDALEARITLAAYCKMVRETFMQLLLFGKSNRVADKIGCGRLVLGTVEVESKLLGLDTINVVHTSPTFERMLDRLTQIKAQAAGLPAPPGVGDTVDGEVVELVGDSVHNQHSAKMEGELPDVAAVEGGGVAGV